MFLFAAGVCFAVRSSLTRVGTAFFLCFSVLSMSVLVVPMYTVVLCSVSLSTHHTYMHNGSVASHTRFQCERWRSTHMHRMPGFRSQSMCNTTPYVAALLVAVYSIVCVCVCCEHFEWDSNRMHATRTHRQTERCMAEQEHRQTHVSVCPVFRLHVCILVIFHLFAECVSYVCMFVSVCDVPRLFTDWWWLQFLVQFVRENGLFIKMNIDGNHIKMSYSYSKFLWIYHNQWQPK